jgi:hypothetical protein
MTHQGTFLPDSVGNVKMLLSTWPVPLAHGDSIEAVFGLVLGEGLVELQRNSDTMAAIGNSLIVTSIDQPGTAGTLPHEYRLDQNYPNPFNPTTVIKYQTPTNNHVTLAVFDVLGREVATLVDEFEGAGFKSVQFNAGGLSSGVYYYRLQAGSYAETKKLLLLK